MFRQIRSLFRPLRLYWNNKNRQRYSRRFGSYGNNTVVATRNILKPQNVFLGDNVIIQDNVNFISNKGRLFVGDFSVISANCIIIPGSHLLKVGVPFFLSASEHIADEEGDIIIKEDCWIGAGTIILPNVKIGRGCVVGAGSVVTKDLPDYAVAVGSPARMIATKFDKQGIINHEKTLYPAQKRLSSDYLDGLFEKYAGLRTIGVDTLTEHEKSQLLAARHLYAIKDYSSL